MQIIIKSCSNKNIDCNGTKEINKGIFCCLFCRIPKSTAQELFQVVVQQAENISWHRATNSAQNWLADIAIKQGLREQAQKLLIKGLTVAQSTKNKRRLARYQRSFALWHQIWGSSKEGYEFASQAMDNFRHLGMIRDVEEIQSLLLSLQSKD